MITSIDKGNSKISNITW